MGGPYARAVSPEEVSAAREGRWDVTVTETKRVPRAWLPAVAGLDVLCLASGGGQQGPLLAAAGANVTVLDLSEAQLGLDRHVAEREGLPLRTVQGSMTDLSVFADASFDVIIHPVATLFVPDVMPVWKEAFRTLRRGGRLVAGFINPLIYIFDRQLLDASGTLEVRYQVPYADETQLPQEVQDAYRRDAAPFEFSHTLTTLIGGQTDVGFVIAGLYEDAYDPALNERISKHHPTMIATLALKP
ncbi:class I SAM-dependent methyltransferase [Deinococcus pimensis]|uniref:class I SAM-dependent methyltransferase n=1 Tax=Deinococcus pimensis TaxID=309888 RepID=UPI0005EB4954|nr:class I SAM-dependent methyltransferase [Deinococcus pimensis]